MADNLGNHACNRDAPILSLVVPVYFNEPSLNPLYARIVSAFDGILEEGELEILFVDDGSGDGSFQVLSELARRDQARVRVVRLARNFGSHAAILAGLNFSRGTYVAMITADLQDPPELVARMLERAREDNTQVVLAVRDAREEPALQVRLANTYYWIMRTLTDAEFPPGGFDCFLIHRQVADAVTRLNETNTSITAQILWLGFRRSSITYVRKARAAGRSRWTLRKKLRLVVDSLISFSRLPIRLVEFTGFVAMACGLAYAALVIALRLMNSQTPPGWASLMVVLLVMSGLILMSLGIIGEYLWRILDTARNRPVYIVADTLNTRRDPVDEPPH